MKICLKIITYIAVILTIISFGIKWSSADTAQRFSTYSIGGNVTAENLNGNFNNLVNVLNGGLDNVNADTSDGFRFIEVFGSTPAAGEAGRVVVNTTDDTILLDTGSEFLKAPFFSGTEVGDDLLVFNGTNWVPQGASTASVQVGAITASKLADNSLVFSKFDQNGNFGPFTGAWSFDDLESDFISFPQTTAPTTAVNEGAVYTKDTSGQPELFYREESDGDEVQLTSGGNPLGGTKFLSTTSGTGTNTGNIAIAPDNRYLVYFSLVANAVANEANVSIRFNSLGTTIYAWAGEGKSFATTVVITTDGDGADTEISLMEEVAGGYVDQMQNSGSDGFAHGQFFIDTNDVGTAYSAMVNGDFIARDENDAIIGAEFWGQLVGDQTVADFEMVFSQDMVFTVSVYEMQ